MKATKGTKVSGTYSNGIQTWEFAGTIVALEWDTAGGDFGHALIDLEKNLDGRTTLFAMTDHRSEIIDDRFAINS